MIVAQFDVRWQLGFCKARCSRRSNHGWTVLIAYIVLQYYYRTYTALLASDNGVEVGVIYFSSFNHFSRSLCVLARASVLTIGRYQPALLSMYVTVAKKVRVVFKLERFI